MSTRELPARPNLEHLKKQARTLLNDALNGDPSAASRFAAIGVTAPPKLADALHAIAREYNFNTWPEMKLQIEANSDDPTAAFLTAVKANDAALLRRAFQRYPSLKSTLDEPLPDYGFEEQPILIAVRNQNREMIETLLEAGADINARSQWWAGSFGVLDWAEGDLAAWLIARGAKLDIHSASRLGVIEKVREFLAVDPQLVHARGGDGQLPLHFAASIEIAQLLLDAGAELDIRDIDHESTAVQYMVLKPERHDVARFLIAKGAKADIFAAAALGDLRLAEELLNDDPDRIRMTVSDRYFPKQNPRAGGVIYMYGFGITATPHAIARRFEHAEIQQLLLQRSPVWMRIVQYAEMGNEAGIVEILERHPAAISKLSELSAKRIIGGAVRNNLRAVELLIRHGWPATPRMNNGQTALHFASWHGNAGLVRLLLAHGADPNVFETEHGGNTLAWALHGSLNSWARSSGDYAEVARQLLAAGANIPRPLVPLEGSDEIMEVIEQHKDQQGLRS
ncbi:ankyrin repeat domain-containing protein [Silvibacterium acidisoli]|uniref:ankyrin repeat domain-containing protein n=1 Tax=Acidobacteriaceae bacterium ZG23-2 TaxID=2883246 RepID=UPI00406CD0DF